MTSRHLGATVATIGITLVLAGCGGSADESSRGEQGAEGRLTVLAAASLTEPFDELAERFEDEHPGVEVATSYDSSATIAAQVAAGAPADVVATADAGTMAAMRKNDALAGPPSLFARNSLALVVPADNPAGIDALGDLESAEYVVCVRSAPCGALAEELLARNGISKPPRSFEVDVKAALTKVQLGEADAGLVYASDVVAAGESVEEIPLPEGAVKSTSYPIAVTTDSAHPDLARSWVDLVRSPAGQRALAEAGFATDAGTGSAP